MNNDRDELLRRLLGPEGPELGCEQCFEELDRYVDLEVARAPSGRRRDRWDARAPRGLPGVPEEHESLRALVQQEG